MSCPMTQILWPSSITITQSGTTTLSNSNTIKIMYPTYTGTFNEISIDGSGTSGAYLGNPSSTGSVVNSLTMRGSGGGNLNGIPDVVYINMRGNIEVVGVNTSTGTTIIPASILLFTLLFQITITGITAIVSLVNPYAEITPTQYNKIIFNGTDSITLTSTPVSVSYANSTRYICIGDNDSQSSVV